VGVCLSIKPTDQQLLWLPCVRVLCVCVLLCVLADTTSGTLTAACTTMSASRLSSITLVSARGLPQSTLVRHRRRNISAHKPSPPQRRRRTYQARVSLRALRLVVQGQGARWSPVCLYICLSAMSASASVSVSISVSVSVSVSVYCVCISVSVSVAPPLAIVACTLLCPTATKRLIDCIVWAWRGHGRRRLRPSWWPWRWRERWRWSIAG
jgi:hypothetical protein